MDERQLDLMLDEMASGLKDLDPDQIKNVLKAMTDYLFTSGYQKGHHDGVAGGWTGCADVFLKKITEGNPPQAIHAYLLDTLSRWMAQQEGKPADGLSLPMDPGPLTH